MKNNGNKKEMRNFFLGVSCLLLFLCSGAISFFVLSKLISFVIYLLTINIFNLIAISVLATSCVILGVFAKKLVIDKISKDNEYSIKDCDDMRKKLYVIKKRNFNKERIVEQDCNKYSYVFCQNNVDAEYEIIDDNRDKGYSRKRIK